MESLSNTLSDNSGLVAGLLIGGAVIGYVISRRPKGLQPKGAAGYRDERVTPGYFVFTALKLFASR